MRDIFPRTSVMSVTLGSSRTSKVNDGGLAFDCACKSSTCGTMMLATGTETFDQLVVPTSLPRSRKKKDENFFMRFWGQRPTSC